MSTQKKTRYFHKGEKIYCLLTSHTQPNTFIPVTAIVQDMQWDEINPIYQVKIIRFFDNIFYLKKYLPLMRFANKFKQKPFYWTIKEEEFKTQEALLKRIHGTNEKSFYVIVDSVLCTKYEKQMRDLFAKLIFFLVGRDMQNIKENCTRSFYKGDFKFDSFPEFETRFENIFSDKFESKEALKKFLKAL